jgi:transposase
LAKAHARTGDAAAIAGYFGHDGRADLREALADWAQAYGDRNAADYEMFRTAIVEGRLTAADDPHL